MLLEATFVPCCQSHSHSNPIPIPTTQNMSENRNGTESSRSAQEVANDGVLSNMEVFTIDLRKGKKTYDMTVYTSISVATRGIHPSN